MSDKCLFGVCYDECDDDFIMTAKLRSKRKRKTKKRIKRAVKKKRRTVKRRRRKK